MNKVILSGEVESEPSVRYFGHQHVRADFTLRTDEYFPRPDGEADRHIQLRHQIQAWGEVAIVIEQTVRQGQHIQLEGRLSYDSYTDRQGTSHTRPVVDCQQIQILSTTKPATEQSLERAQAGSTKELDWILFAPTEDEDPMA